MKRSAVREAVGRFRAANPRVFGSVLHGTDRDGSDLDLLVDALPLRWTWAIWKKN
jgi:predicted nucleotidyltransferase